MRKKNSGRLKKGPKTSSLWRRAFAFVSCPVKVQCELPYSITDEVNVARPSASQLQKIRKFLEDHNISSHNNPFEREYTKLCESGSDDEIPIYSYSSKRLPKSEWQYLVVNFSGVTAESAKFFLTETRPFADINAIQHASKLMEPPLRLRPVFLPEFRVAMNDTSDWERFQGISITGEAPLTVSSKYLAEFKRLHLLSMRVAKTHPDIIRSIQLYGALPERIGYNELTILGLFSVLESILTHNPKGEHDSITHQIRSKIALVGKRLGAPIDYGCFQQAKQDKIWTRLYELRSRIAHGGEIDFGGSLSILRDLYTVELFLKQSVRRVLRRALKEPDLFIDLRAV